MAEPTGKNTELTVFVGNLGKEVTEDEIRGLFKECGQVKDVRIIRDRERNPKGFAYVEFMNQETVDKVLGTMSDKDFKGNKIKVDKAGEPRRIRRPNEPNPPSPTVYLGNLSFDCTEDDIRKAFAKCGNLVNVRMMMNEATGKCRGFAYVEFSNVDEAKKALSMNSENVLERPIKVDYAAPPNTRVRRVFRGRGRGRGGMRGRGEFRGRGRGTFRGAARGEYRGRGEFRGRGRGSFRGRGGRRPNQELSVALSEKTVFVGNLPQDITPEEIHEAVSKFGRVVNIEMAVSDGRPRGYAYVHYQEEQQALAASSANNNVALKDKILRIEKPRMGHRA